MGTRNSASPYASLYNQSKEELLFGELHHQIIAFLKQHKLQVQSDFVEPADHIAVILAYAGHLAINADINEQSILLNGYLANWLPTFATQVKQSDPSGFYTAVTQLTVAWVTSELEWLASFQPNELALIWLKDDATGDPSYLKKDINNIIFTEIL